MDVAAWNAEKLVDGISPGCYNTDFQPACETVEGPRRRSDVDPLVHRRRPRERPCTTRWSSTGRPRRTLTAPARTAFTCFNFPCLDELSRLLPTPVDRPPMPPPAFRAQGWQPDLDKTRAALGELGDPAGLARKDKHYLFYVPNANYPHYTQEHAAIDRRQPQPAEMVFRCYHAAEAKAVRLQVKAANVTIRDEFSLALNGRAIDAARIRRLHASGGRDARIHSIPLQPYSQYIVTLAPDMLQRGENRLAVSLCKGEPELFGSIELVELELFLHY